MITVDDVLARLSKDSLSKVRLAKDISRLTIPTASLGLNLLLGGGIGIGKQTTFWGNEQAGKSLLCMQTIAQSQKDGVVCGYIDVEKSFDYVWAKRLGVDVDSLVVSQVSSIGAMANLVLDMIRSGVGLLVVDSYSALLPGSYYDKDGSLKPFEDTRQLGQKAKELGQAASMIQGENFTCALIFISQIRIDVGAMSMVKPFKTSGGKEIGHLDSLRIRLFTSQSDSKAIMSEVAYGDTLLEEVVGRTVTWSVDKNRMNGRYATGTYDIYTVGDTLGVDRVGEILDYGTKYGLVDRAGSWYTIMGERRLGRAKAVEYLRNDTEVYEKMEAEIFAKSV